MGGYDAPAFGETRPDLGLTAFDCAAFGSGALEFEGNAAVVGAEGDDIEPLDGAGKTDGWSGLAEGFEFFNTVEVFGDAEAHYVG